MERTVSSSQSHSSAWIFHSWLSFALSVGSMAIGIYLLPVNGWQKGYLGMGLIFTVGATVNMSKTTRDLHESKKMIAKVEEAKVEKLLASNNL